MAYTVLNIIGGSGDDLAGGSGTGAVTASDTGGNGTVLQGGGAGGGTSDKYTANSGTPFSATQVNDYISIYTGTPSATSYVAKVTAINAGGASVDYDSTTGYGTRPANGATNKAKTGGAWNSFTPLANFSTATSPQSTRIDVKGNSTTYTLSGALTIALAGTTSKPTWIRGYKSSPGDLDNVGSTTATDYPLVSGGANATTFSGAYTLITGISFTASRSGSSVLTATNPPIRFRHCRFASTSANSAALAATAGIAVTEFTACYFTTPSTANAIVSVTATASFFACYIDGAGTGTTQVGVTTTSALNLIGCTINHPGSHGVNLSAGTPNFVAFGCTFNACGAGSSGGDAIRLTSIPANTTAAVVANCAFFLSGSASAGYDVNNPTGTTANVELCNNLSYSPFTAHLNGFGDWAEMNALTDSGDPRVSSSDLHLITTSNGAGTGLPGQWEGGVTGVSYDDVGAWQRQVTAAGGLLGLSGMTAGMQRS